MKLLLSNLFSVMAASSFVSSANAITLDDYSKSSIGPETDLANACTIGTVTATGALLTCGFMYATTSSSDMAGSTIVADLYSGECSNSVGEAAVAVDHADKMAGIGVVQTELEMDAFGVAGDSDKNTGSIEQKYCARADVWDDNAVNQASGSVLSYMMTVTTTITFDQEGAFTVDVTTAEFTAADAAAAATRTIPVFARVGACTAGTSTALKNQLQVGTVAIGEVLDICAFVDYDVDSDVQIAKVKSVVIKDGDTTITTPVDGDGAPNFVTTAEQNAEAVKISTLMIPKIYDTLTLTEGAGSFTISGVAELTYIAGTRHLSSGERRLQSEEAPFSLEVDLTKNDLPQVAMNEEESGAMSAGVGMMALAAGVAALL